MFRVTPGIAPETVFEALLIETPSTVSDALVPVTGCVNPKAASPVTVELEALPEELATRDRREPLASVITFAVTPRLSALIWLAAWARVCVPSVVMVCAVPLPLVMVKLPAGRSAAPDANSLDVQGEVGARLSPVTTCVPCGVPEAALAETRLEFDDETVAEARGPVMLFNCSTSLSRV